MHFVAMAGLGALLGHFELYSTLLAIVCAAFLWQACVSINDLFDLQGDEISKRTNPIVRGAATATDITAIAASCAILSILVATLLGYEATILALLFLALSLHYSIPPIRLKKYPIISTLVIASGSLLAFALGFYSAIPKVAFPITLAIAILVCFTLAFNTRDLKDYEGDKASRIWTIPVLLGPKKGRIVVATLDLLAYLAAPIILSINTLFIPAVILGIATFLVVLRKESKEWQIFLLYFLFLATLIIMR